jgi:hypothetical protein
MSGIISTLARRWNMARRESATVAARPHRAWLAAIAALALLAAGGCEHHRRQTLRPVYRAPAAVSAPCTNCGTGSGAIVTTPGAVSTPRALSSEPAIDESAPAGGTESSVPSLGPTSGSARNSLRSPLPEQPPKASIGSDPSLDDLPSKSSPQRSSRGSSSGTTGGAPALQGPGAASLNSRDGVRTASATGPLRRTAIGAQDRLRPFLGDSDGNELFYPNKADRPWKYIVLHHSANPEGDLDRIDSEHRKVLGFDGCGYHFVIGNGSGSDDGQIQVARRWANQKHGVHCRNAKDAEIDEYGIGICLVGDLDKEPPTPRQVAAAKSLVAYLSARYAIAPGRVETHSHLAATPTVCPGKHFPTDTFVAITPADEEAIASRTVPTTWRVVRRDGSRLY